MSVNITLQIYEKEMTDGAGRHLFWRRYAPFLVQVCPFLAQVRPILGAGVPILGAGVPILGAGTPHSWRRWGFGWGTCATAGHRTTIRGAGPHPFSSPAPKHPYTCAKTPLHLRQQSTSPATRIMYKRDLYNGMVFRRRFLVQVFQGRCPKGRLTRYLNTKQPSEMH